MAATRYADADGDGFGAGASFKCPATTSTPFATKAGDCNDNDASVNPGAIDDTLNGVDNNCNGQVDEDVCPCARLYPGQNWAQVVIQGSSVGFKDMTPADALAIAQYLKTVPAIDNRVR